MKKKNNFPSRRRYDDEDSDTSGFGGIVGNVVGGLLGGGFLGAMGVPLGPVLGAGIAAASLIKSATSDQERIDSLINDQKMSQADIARELDVSVPTVGRWYNGQKLNAEKSLELQKLYESKQVKGTVLLEIKCNLVDRAKLDAYLEDVDDALRKLNDNAERNINTQKEIESLCKFAVISDRDNLQSAQINDNDILIIQINPRVEYGAVQLINYGGFCCLYRVYKYPQDGSKLRLKNDVEEKICNREDISIIGPVINIVKGKPASVAP